MIMTDMAKDEALDVLHEICKYSSAGGYWKDKLRTHIEQLHDDLDKARGELRALRIICDERADIINNFHNMHASQPLKEIKVKMERGDGDE